MVELVLITSSDRADALSTVLIDELGAGSVSLEDADADAPIEQPLYGEPGLAVARAGWPHSRLVALFDREAQAQAAAAWVLAWAGVDGEDCGGGERVRVEAIRPVPAQDWVRLTQSQFEPVAVTPEFWIVPSWHDVPPQATRVIRLDPGQAFGTGTHPTTQLCLRWIARQAAARESPWQRVLDYGCGSGVLAIAAARFGARRIDAVDLDPAAVRATHDNAAANAVTLRCGAPELAQGTYDLVLANILASPLTVLAPLLAGHVAAGGDLVLAGILERQAEALREAYARWLVLGVGDTQDGWILMTARRAA